MKFITKICVATMMLAEISATAAADAFPSKTVSIVVPFPPGGGTDILARPLAQELSARWGQPVLVDNRAGAGGNIGTEFAARAAPDGQTIVLGTVGTHAINQSLYKNVKFDAVRDFAAITIVANTPNVLVVHPSMKANSVQELIAYAKENPGKLNYGSPGNGTPPHLAAEVFKNMAGISIVHIPYKGSAPAMADLLSGQVQMMIANAPVVLPYIKTGRLKALATTSLTRPASLSNIPTISESGLTGYEADTWYGLFAPAGTPAPIMAKLSKDVTAALKTKAVSDFFALQGADIIADKPNEAAKKVSAEVAKWRQVITDNKVRID